MGSNAAKLMDLALSEAARVLVQNADEAWLAELQRSLDQRRAHADLDRILAVWDLNQSDAAELFGVSRQAVSKWRAQGVPTSRIDAGDPAIRDLVLGEAVIPSDLARARSAAFLISLA